MYGHTDLKKGVLIQIDGAPHQVIESSHIAMGRGGAVMRTKLKNLKTGAVYDKSFRSSDKIPAADVTKETMQFLYTDGDALHFMNSETYEQTAIDKGLAGEAEKYLTEGSKAIVMSFDGKPMGLDYGNNVYLKVSHAEPGAKGDTATAALKPAVMETGLEVMVPLFVNEDDVIKVDTRDGKYLERKK
ncbi:MAG TPA: elongation factor P [Candidatus Saccharimonadales bacterium]|nr:elongation factor P [Candidatus Saccharimonadales bacterium]